MRTKLNIFILITAFLTLIGCHKFGKNEIELTPIAYGKFINNSLSVEVDLNKFKNFKEFFQRTERIVCNDSFPKLTLNKDKKQKIIYFQSLCWEGYICILIKEKNIFEIHNDTIYKIGFQYPLDSLEKVLMRDIENNGNNPMLSENLESLIIQVSYSNFGLDKLPKTLELITDTYENITNKRDLTILLSERLEIIAPPPPPPRKSLEN